MGPMFVWFLLIGPPEAFDLGPWGFWFHSNLALLFVIICLGWTFDFLWRGIASSRMPKLPPWAKWVHWWMHRIIIWGLFAIALGGFLLGLTSPILLKAGGFLPIAPPFGFGKLNDWIGFLHIIQFYALSGLIVVHATFHIWRHYYLRDNALRIMVPKILHRFF